MTSIEGQADTAVDQRVFPVLGSHRTGTSLITRVLQILGLYLGQPSQLLGPIKDDNETGFYEHRAVMRVSAELLARHGGSWRDPPALPTGWDRAPALDDLREHARKLVAADFADRSLWGFKDPRASLTLPFWRTVVSPTGYVLAHRNPLEVAASLQSRNGIALVHGVALWTYYTASAIVNTTGQRRFFVGYAELLTRRRQAQLVTALSEFLGVRSPREDLESWRSIQEAVDKQLRHQAVSRARLGSDPAMSPEARELFELLERAGRSPGRTIPSTDDRGRAGNGALDVLAAQIVELGPPRESAVPAGVTRRHLGPRPPRVVAMLQVFNERRFLAGCIEHLSEQGIGVYVIDNESTDETLEIAQRYLGKGVIGIETLRRDDCFALRVQCRRQEELAMTLDADWLIHHDADEIRVSRKRGQTVAEAIAEYDRAGFNAVNFLEFTFVATREFPDHDHPGFARTMRWYYPFLPRLAHRCNAWKRQDQPVDLTTHAGHTVAFAGLRMAPDSLYMRHYLFISRQHAIEKFVQRRFAQDELADGWFKWRAHLRPELIKLPSVNELRPYLADHLLDPSEPLTRHVLDQAELEVAASAAS